MRRFIFERNEHVGRVRVANYAANRKFGAKSSHAPRERKIFILATRNKKGSFIICVQTLRDRCLCDNYSCSACA